MVLIGLIPVIKEEDLTLLNKEEIAMLNNLVVNKEPKLLYLFLPKT